MEIKKVSEPVALTTGFNNQNAMKYVETASISSGSEQKITQDNFFQNNLNHNYGQVDSQANSNPQVKPQVQPPYPTPSQVTSQVPSSSQLPQAPVPKYQSEFTPSVPQQPIPTKDYSDASIVNQYKPPSEHSKPVIDTVSKAISSSYESNVNKDILYNPKIDAPLYNPKPEMPLYNTSPIPKAPVESKNAGYEMKTTNQYASSSVPMGKKKGVFGLNVSDEFTST